MKIGIDDMSFYIPQLYLSIEELADKRNISFAKLNKGLGLTSMSLIDKNEDASSMAANAVLDLIKKNNLKPNQIGRIYVGSESSTDGAKPIASYVVSMLSDYFEKEYGKNSFRHTDCLDLTFACIAGIDALHNTIDWVKADPTRIGIVVATDNAKYELESTGEYTQGAGAVASLIMKQPRLLAMDKEVGISTIGEHDFFKPLRKVLASQLPETSIHFNQDKYVEIHRIYPVFDGQYSNQCYTNRVAEAYQHFKIQKSDHKLEDWDKIIFHLPYAYHGKRAFIEVFWACYKNDEQLKKELLELDPNFENKPELKLVSKTASYKKFVQSKIEKSQRASSHIGNMYTASIFMAFMSMLETEWEENNDINQQKIGFCAYGSGSKSKVFQGQIQEKWQEVVSHFKLFKSLKNRHAINFDTYEKLHSGHIQENILPPKSIFYLNQISEDEKLYGKRIYTFAE